MAPVQLPFLAALGVFALAATSASAQVKWQDGMLTDDKGIPLFVSEAEPQGISQCYGACLNVWLPYKAPVDARATGELSIIKRDDGISQWSFRGKALYHWFNFDKPMDGQGMRGGNWHVVKQN